MFQISKFAIPEWLSKGVYEALKQFLQEILKPNADDVLLDVGGGTSRLAGYFVCRYGYQVKIERAPVGYLLSAISNGVKSP